MVDVSGVAVRGHAFSSSSGSWSASITLPTCEYGDRLVVFTGGGSRVTGYPGGAWKQVAYQTGQEAQGWAMTKIATPEDSGAVVTLSYDGWDQRSLFAVVSEGPAEFSLFVNDRFGVAGSSFPASEVGAAAPAAVDDSLAVLAFARNASSLPTSTLGDPVDSSLAGGCAAAAWLATAPGYGAIAIETSMPDRSGHYLVGVSFWNRSQLITEDYVFNTDIPGDTQTWSAAESYDNRSFQLTDLIAPDGSIYDEESLPAGIDHIRVEADVVGSGNVRWLVSFDSSYAGYFATANDPAYGQVVVGEAHLYDPVVHAYFGPDFSVAEVYARARAGAAYGDSTVWNNPGTVVLTAFRFILFSKARMPIAAPAIVGTDDGVRRRFVRARR